MEGKKIKWLVAGVVVCLLVIVGIAVWSSAWWPFGKADEFDRLVDQGRTNSAAQAQVDALTKSVEEGVLDKTSAALLSAQLKGAKTHAKDSPDLMSRLVYCNVLVAVADGGWNAVGDWKDYAQRNQLLDAKYGPAIALYAAELTVQSGDTLAAVATLNGLSNSSLRILWLPERMVETVGQAAKARVRQLEFGRQVIWVSDSKPGRRGYAEKIAQAIQAKTGVRTQVRKKWKLWVDETRLYCRIAQNNIASAEILSVLADLGIIGVVPEAQRQSRGAAIKKAFLENEKLCFLLILN